MKNSSKALFQSVVALILCVSMLVGTTFAWFTDSVISGVNKIQSGNLDVELVDAAGNSLEGKSLTFLDVNGKANILWEPGCTFKTQGFRVSNKGDLALKYTMYINGLVGDSKLLEVIDFSIEDTQGNKVAIDDFVGKLSGGAASELYYLVGHMDENAGNDYMGKTLSGLGITVYATQDTAENDSFGSDYDAGATFPTLKLPGSITANVQSANGLVSQALTMADAADTLNAQIPTGVKLGNGVTELTLSVTEMTASGANIELQDNEILRSLDVHIEGVAADNMVPMLITIREAMMVGLNIGNYTLYHVENGVANAMTSVTVLADLDAHNEFYYDPATGDVTLSLATFSEVALVAEESKWEGNRDYSWYTNAVAPVDGEEVTEYIIANADQLAAFGAIVGGMDGQTQDSFAGKTVKLIADINLGDKESENNPDLIFYPIGYYNSEGTYERTNTAISSGFYAFQGTFDGNGHTISNFYQNTWEMKGDHDWYSPEEQYYRDGMGLFGKVYGGTVKNLTVSNFSSDGEIATTGVIAAYADGATFENIAIFNCNPRVYNIGNGGIVGCVGWYAKEADLKTTFTNITVDNSNKISALWGSYDVACGGIVGQYYPTSGQSSANYPVNAGIHFENCHVSAQMDVYNDVCANYQYYAYRYSGMLIGSVRENVTIDGHVYPKMDGITAEGCTVHFGTWNDYYYCEIIDNTTASYTHDYQMSRLTEIKAIDGTTITYLDGTTGTVPASGRANYVIVDYTKGHGTENATCYHFKDGAVWTHDMGGIQTGIDENGDGQDDLKEDKQHIYLEFNNLVTGYGWGVTTKSVGDLEGVTILDRATGDSVEKFESEVEELANNKEYKLGDIFNFVDNGVTLVPGALAVSVTNKAENNPVSATIVYDRENWENGTITLTGTGEVQITIQDYYFCTPTTIEVTVTDRQPEVKFETKFTGDFLYRVGNADGSNVALGTLFSGTNVTNGNVTVSFETIAGNASGAYIANASAWENSKIQFSGAGVVKVTITDNDYCIATNLTLEVVNATNVPENGKIGNYNTTSVLLGNTSVSTLYLNGGATLYGNGFTIDCTNAPINGTGNVSGNYVIGLAGANLDNVQIVGRVYTEYGAMAGNDYNRALIISTGNSTITNCCLSNTASPVRINGGSLYIKGTTIRGGNFANVDVRSGHLTLDNVTTINQALGNDNADDGSAVIGLGVVVYYELVNTSATSITVKNGLTQYNNISTNDEFSNDYANQFVSGMFNSSNSALQYKKGDVTWVNAGIILMTGGINVTGAGNKTDVSFMGATGNVYTTVPTMASIEKEPLKYTTLGQGVLAPTATLDHDNEAKGNYIPKETGKNDYCYFDGEKVLISMKQGDTFTYDPFILDATKLDNTLVYTVRVNGNATSNGSKISFNEAGEYIITYTYEDPYNYRLDQNGELETFAVTYTKTDVVNVAVVEPEAEHAKFTFETNDTATEEILYNNNTYISAKGVTADGTTWGKITVGDKTIYYPIVTANVNRNTTSKECQVFYYVFKNVVSITDSNGTVYSHNNKTGTDGKMPSNLQVIKGNELKVENNVFTNYNDSNLSRTGGKIFCYSSSGQEDTPEAFEGALAYKSPSGLGYSSSTRNYDAAVIVQYQFTDSNNATYYYYVGYKISNPNNGNSGDGEDTSCVTPDTLITLADGTQVRVDSLTGNEELLVWNMETGKLDSAPILFVDSDPETEYEIIHLYFSDGTDVKVIYEHGFWDYDLNKYVYLDASAEQYIGHTFAKQDGDKLTKVVLTDVVIEKEVTTAWSPVTAGHLCYFVNGMLSMPGGVGGLFNIFDVDAETMTYDYEAMAKDIETYGLFTYEELNAICPLSEEMFNAAGGAYLKVSIGKGNMTMDDLIYMINRYSKFFN